MLNKFSGKVAGLVSHLGKYCFSIRTTHKQWIQKSSPVTTDFNRDSLKRLTEDPEFEIHQQQKKEQERKKAIEQTLFEIKSNERNPANLIKVKINNPLLNALQTKQEISQADTKSEVPSDTPFCLMATPRLSNPCVIGTRRRIPISLTKLRQPVKSIRGKHLYEAIGLLQASRKHSCAYILKALLQVRRHAKVKGLDENRLYVAGILFGKNRRFHKLRYHAKGRAGAVTTDICQVTIKLEERSVEEMFRSMMKGSSPPMLAYLIREKLAQEEVGLDRLRKNNFILTAKGRQQKKLMLKRKALIKYYEFRKKGVKVPLKLITEKIVNSEASKFVEEYKTAITERKQDSYNARLAVYKKNSEKTG